MVQNLFKSTNNKSEWIVRGIEDVFTEDRFKYASRLPIDDEFTIMYEGFHGDDPIPQEFEFMNVKITKYSPFYYLSLPARKFAAEKRDLLREIYDDIVLK